jgi:predicted RNA-binding Zn-ribbon protein involved in translation (DUF1610 family)
MEKELKCNSCGVKLTSLVGSVKFSCPSCGKSDISRCKKCRGLGTRYKCKDCGFEGPN